MTTNVDLLVDRYLTDLEAELRDLPANRSREILDEVGEHIAAARATLDAETEAAVRTVLERLGDPADIAAEARDRFGVQGEPARPTPWLEVIAIVALVIPFLGWLVGTVLVWLSRRWTTRDKLIGTLGGMSWVVAGLGTLSMSARGSTAVGSPQGLEPTGPGAIAVILFVAPFILPIAAAIYLGIRLRAHASTLLEPHQRSGHGTPWLEVATLVALLVPVLGWVVGVVLLWLSRTWTTREKATGTLLALGVGALALLALSSPVEWIRPLLVMVLTIPTVTYLGIRLRAHADAMPVTG
jgi:uncharacterized Tic20 family protein